MRAFESFMELSFFDIGEVIELDDLVVAPRSCFCCTPYDSLRSLCISIAHSKSFEIGVSIVIALSMLAIAIEGPPGEYEKKNSSMRMFHEVTEIVFLALFWVEFGVKVTAFSFARHRYAYIRDWWNRFDFFVLVMGTTELAFSNAGMSFGGVGEDCERFKHCDRAAVCVLLDFLRFWDGSMDGHVQAMHSGFYVLGA
jgi:hypothetical protein